MSEKTVFISYRRDALGKAFARSLKHELEHKGYDVFLDVDSIGPGEWEEQLRGQVPVRSHFLLLLTPGALDRCEDPDDWVRREFELAVQHKRNIVPVAEESVDLTDVNRTCPDSMKGVFTLQVPKLRHGSYQQDVATLIDRFIPRHKAPLSAPTTPVSKSFTEAVGHLHTTKEIRDSIEQVISQPDFPQWMSLSGRLVRNPVWDVIPESEQRKILEQHKLDGPRAPTVMHVDLLLIRRNDRSGRGELYTYSSDAWKTPLIPFRHRFPQDDPNQRQILNAQHLAKYWDVSAESVQVEPLPGKYAVNAKLNAEYRDLFLYVFEMCSVIFTEATEPVRAKMEAVGPPWFDLHGLRNSAGSMAVNGDVIRALHELFTVNLGALRNSFQNQSPSK
jgi:hypothetical protein